MTSALAPRRPRQRTVSFLLFDGVASLDLVGPADAFAAANDLRAAEGKHAAYRIVTLGVGKRRCAAESGVLLEAHAELGSSLGGHAHRPGRSWLARAYNRATRGGRGASSQEDPTHRIGVHRDLRSRSDWAPGRATRHDALALRRRREGALSAPVGRGGRHLRPGRPLRDIRRRHGRDRSRALLDRRRLRAEARARGST